MNIAIKRIWKKNPQSNDFGTIIVIYYSVTIKI